MEAAQGAPVRLYHAHVYYDMGSFPEAEDFCRAAVAAFRTPMGHMHQRPVGPHPVPSCQLTVAASDIAGFLAWAEDKRGELTLMIHSLSGDELYDHTHGVIWLGQPQPLKLDIFRT